MVSAGQGQGGGSLASHCLPFPALAPAPTDCPTASFCTWILTFVFFLVGVGWGGGLVFKTGIVMQAGLAWGSGSPPPGC